MPEFTSSAPSEHERNEELQWARILAKGDPVCGMIFVFAQKLCTAFHELQPAQANTALKEDHLEFFRTRLAARTKKVLDVSRDHNLHQMSAAGEFQVILEAVNTASSLDELAALTEDVHRLNHRLCDTLEKMM